LDEKIILAHEEIEEKTNEIPVSQKFFEELWVKWMIFTLDALHCQKKLLKK
jgi:predicted transposase YbfD/YdcC